jgi:DNA modification methylase
MRVVTIARKPMLSTAAVCAVECGTGSLNIDGCRIQYQDQADRREETRGVHVGGAYEHAGGSAFKKAVNFVAPAHAQGRWPANVVLMHRAGCKQTGTTTAPGYVINRWDDGAKPFGGGAGHEFTSEKQGDEQVAVWECVEGCSVEDLGKQSGKSQGSGGSTSGMSAFGQNSGWNFHNNRPTEITRPNDAGTAARYFKQVQEIEMNELPSELFDYLITMISPPASYEPVIIAQPSLEDYPWEEHEDASVHGMITMGNPEPYMKEIDRVLKPGAHVLMISDDTDLTGAEAACAIEDFGYEIRDAISVLDTPGEFHYVAKSGKKERNAGVPVFKAEVTFERYFPLEGVDQDDLWEQINEVVAEKYLDNWLIEGIPEEELPDHLLSLFEERVLVDVTEFRNNHTTVKPIAIMEALMEDLPQGSLIVDPFMGSGTTGIAALKQKMGFIGIEQDANYLKIAHHRIHHADRANAAWLAADIESEAEEEEEESKSLMDFFGI